MTPGLTNLPETWIIRRCWPRSQRAATSGRGCRFEPMSGTNAFVRDEVEPSRGLARFAEADGLLPGMFSPFRRIWDGHRRTARSPDSGSRACGNCPAISPFCPAKRLPIADQHVCDVFLVGSFGRPIYGRNVVACHETNAPWHTLLENVRQVLGKVMARRDSRKPLGGSVRGHGQSEPPQGPLPHFNAGPGAGSKPVPGPDPVTAHPLEDQLDGKPGKPGSHRLPPDSAFVVRVGHRHHPLSRAGGTGRARVPADPGQARKPTFSRPAGASG